MEIKDYISKEVNRVHKLTLLESEAKIINKKLAILKEESEEQGEEKPYQSNVYESYKKDLEEVVTGLAEACNKLETAVLKQESHMKTIPEVAERKESGENSKQVILEIFKNVKKAKLAAERKLYELR